MIIRFWGVRGSIAAPGAATLRYGGNTACISIEIDQKILVIDAGTGIRGLGEELAGLAKEIFVLITHPHADHTGGFPFFAPLFESGRCIDVFDFESDGRIWSLLELFDGIQIPVRPAQAVAACRQSSGPDLGALRERGFEIRQIPLNHPGGAFGFRVTAAGRSYVHMTDNELDATEPTTSFDAFAAFCHDADVLCHDAQYVDEDMPAKRGWGHSTVTRACDLAVAAGVRRLVLFHHDPARTDVALDEIGRIAKARLAPHSIGCDVAWEGLAIEL